MVCKQCGSQLRSGAKYCGKCGKKTTWGRVKKIIIITVSIFAALFVASMIAAVIMTNDTTVTPSSNTASSTKAPSTDGKSQAAQTTAVQTPVPTQIPAPVFTSASASSVRPTDTEGGTYSTGAVLTNDPMTKWVPQKSGNGGIGEWIEISASTPQHVTGIKVMNGYQKNSSTWANNNRVSNCTIMFSNGTSMSCTLPDTMDLITIDLSTAIDTTYIRLKIDGIYSGSKWNDTAITYLGAY